MSTPIPFDPKEDRSASADSPKNAPQRPAPGSPAPSAGADDPEAVSPPDADIEAAMAEESSFAEMLSEFEQQHHSMDVSPGESVEGVVIDVTANGVFVDLGLKREGILPRSEALDEKGEPVVKSGDAITVAVTGRSSDGYYTLSTVKAERPKDWSGLEKAFAEGLVISGTVTGVIKGGLSVDVGARAFMPASRSGTRDAAEMEALVGQEIQCKLIQLDTAKEDVVVDRRAVLEEAVRETRLQRFSQLQEGSVVTGTVRSLTDFGAFVDVGGVDGLLHVADMAWHRVRKPSDVLKEGDQIEVKVLRVDPAKQKISLGRKQLIPDPWSSVNEKYIAGQRVTGTVVRLTDFGAFVELEPGVDGMIHISEMSWSKRIKKPSDVLKNGESVETVILSVDGEKRRIALGLRQALGDPWENVESKFPVGSVAEGPVKNMAKFGAFVELAEGLEGMIHIADITNEKRLNHPNEALSEGQTVKAVVLEIDRSRKRIRLGMKQLEPTSADEYISEHKVGDVVSGRVVESGKKSAKVELGDGVVAVCRFTAPKKEEASVEDGDRPDISALSAMLAAKWREGSGAAGGGDDSGLPRAGEVRQFRITNLDPQQKRVEIELAE